MSVICTSEMRSRTPASPDPPSAPRSPAGARWFSSRLLHRALVSLLSSLSSRISSQPSPPPSSLFSLLSSLLSSPLSLLASLFSCLSSPLSSQVVLKRQGKTHLKTHLCDFPCRFPMREKKSRIRQHGTQWAPITDCRQQCKGIRSRRAVRLHRVSEQLARTRRSQCAAGGGNGRHLQGVPLEPAGELKPSGGAVDSDDGVLCELDPARVRGDHHRPADHEPAEVGHLHLILIPALKTPRWLSAVNSVLRPGQGQIKRLQQ